MGLRLGILLSVISAFLIGTALGFILSSFNQIGGLTATILQYTTLIGTVIIVLKFIIEYLQENVFEYAGIYKIEEIRSVFERQGWSRKETERHNEVAYYLKIAKKRGKGRLEECEGIITLDDEYGKTRIEGSWKGSGYEKYRNISIEDNLRLFNITEDKKQILLFGNPDKTNTLMPYTTVYQDLNDEAFNTKLSVTFGAKSGNPPNKPFGMTIRDIIQNAKEH